MNTLTLEIPPEYARSFGATDEEAVRNARIELAIQMYREARWSTGKAAEFAGLGYIAFLDLLRDRKVEKPYTREMLEQDFRYACSHVGFLGAQSADASPP